MSRGPKAKLLDHARQLQQVQTMVKDMEDAMPSSARELRRAAFETLGDVIADLVKQAAGRE